MNPCHSTLADDKSFLLCLPQSNMKSLERELHCPVCKDIVKQPVVLPCQHSVCLMCASEVLVASGYPLPDLPPEPNSPASTPNTRSPRQARRPNPKEQQRPIDRVLRAGVPYCFLAVYIYIPTYVLKVHILTFRKGQICVCVALMVLWGSVEPLPTYIG